MYNSPDPNICEWWDMLTKNGKVIRIKYCDKWKHDYPWHSVEHAYTQDRIDFIGEKFIPIPLSEFK